MKGVILAGGTGSRLRPLTNVTNKHLLPIYNKPMIFYPLETLKSIGINDIMIVTGKNHAGDIFRLMGSGKEFGVKFTYRVQDEPGGIPQAIGLAEDFVGHEKFISINGDNLFLGMDLKNAAEEFKNGKEEARIVLYKTTEQEAKKAGVAILDGDRIKEIIEKPETPPSLWISVGLLMFTPTVFDIIKKLKPSKRGELEIADVQNEYIKRGALKYSKFDGEWMDAGTINELLRANEFVAKNKR